MLEEWDLYIAVNIPPLGKDLGEHSRAFLLSFPQVGHCILFAFNVSPKVRSYGDVN